MRSARSTRSVERVESLRGPLRGAASRGRRGGCKAVVDYANEPTCRSVALRRYFGDEDSAALRSLRSLPRAWCGHRARAEPAPPARSRSRSRSPAAPGAAGTAARRRRRARARHPSGPDGPRLGPGEGGERRKRRRRRGRRGPDGQRAADGHRRVRRVRRPRHRRRRVRSRCRRWTRRPTTSPPSWARRVYRRQRRVTV